MAARVCDGTLAVAISTVWSALTGRSRRLLAGVTSSLTMTQLPALQIFQRATLTGGGQSKGQGSIPVAVNLSAASPLYARIRSSDGTTILQSLGQIVANQAAGAATVSVPGVDARLGWFYVDLSLDNASWVNGTNLVGMGRVVATSGQSLDARFISGTPNGPANGDNGTNANLGVSISPYGSVYASYVQNSGFNGTGNSQPAQYLIPTWQLPSDTGDYMGTGVSEFLRLQIAKAGVNVAMVGHAHGATGIGPFLPGGTESPYLRAALQMAGGFEAFIWNHGHSSTGSTSSAYQNNLTTLFTDAASYNTVRGNNFNIYLEPIPDITSNTWGSSNAINVIRSAMQSWAAANTTYTRAAFVPMADLALLDGTHPLQAGAITEARHLHRATLGAEFGGNSDAGPRMASATRSGLAITIPITMTNGGTALSTTGSPGARFSIFQSGTVTTALALDGTTPYTISGTNLTINLASDPGAVALDIYWAFGIDSAASPWLSGIYDNVTDGDGITTGRGLFPNPVPITAPAPATPPTLATLTLSPTTATANSAYTGTLSNAASGSTITATSSDGTTLTVSGTGTTRTLTGTFTAAGTPTITETETLSGATGSPKTSTQTVTVSAAASGTALDTAYNNATNLTYSNGNKTVTRTDTTNNRAVRSVGSYSTGKVYFEIVENTAPFAIAGLATSTVNNTNTNGTSGVDKIGYNSTGAIIYYNGSGGASATGSIGTPANGDVIQYAIDFDNKLMWVRKNGTGNWNNSASANPATGVGGLSTAGATTYYIFWVMNATSGLSGTLHSTTAEYTYAAPSGFGVAN